MAHYVPIRTLTYRRCSPWLATVAHAGGRRDLGLRAFVAFAVFDLAVIKLAADSVTKVHSVTQLGWILRLISVGSFVSLCGMLFQIEVRNRGNRSEYIDTEIVIKALKNGDPLSPRYSESLPTTVRNSWATTWPLASATVLTAASWWCAGVLHR